MTESNEEFKKIIDDFVADLICSYPELKSKFEQLDYDAIHTHCKSIYPENFFFILYENNEIFDDDARKFLLPEIDFKQIMNDDTLSESSKKTIWKYIQLILFSVCNQLKDRKDFGDANMLFEAIKEDDLHKKIQETMEEMKHIFMSTDSSGDDDLNDVSLENLFDNMMGDLSNVEDMFNGTSGENPFDTNMDPEQMKSHLSSIMDGKIGNLAKEIAEEASSELGIDTDNMDEKDQKDFLKNLFKNPAKLMNVVKSIGTRLEEKFKSGEIKESELMEEAQDIMKKMETMPGIKEMMGSMGMNPGGKFDFKGMANKMQQNMKQSKSKERMQEKLKRNKEAKAAQDNANMDLGNITSVGEDTFIWNESNSTASDPLQKSSKPKRENKKKNNKKKKKKN